MLLGARVPVEQGRQIEVLFSAYYNKRWWQVFLDFSSPSPDHLGLTKPVQAGVKNGYLPKKGVLQLLTRVAWKRLQVVADNAVYHNKYRWGAF